MKLYLLPGLLLAVAVAGLGKIAAGFLPQIGGGTFAILFGIFLGNTLFRQSAWQAGTKLAERKLLEFAVVLLGTRVTFQTILEIGGKGAAYVTILMISTIFFTYLIGRKIGFNQSMSLLMAGGNAVCGSSAIASIAPVIDAKEEEKGQIITLVNLLGTFMMLTLPFLAQIIFSDNLTQSALIGGTLQSVGQVVAGANLIGPQIVQYAMLFKILRIMFLVLVVFSFEKFVHRGITATQEVKRKAPLPWYVIGFLVLCTINSFIQLPASLTSSLSFISSWLETTALAAIGLRLNIRNFLKEGRKFMLYGSSVGLFQIVVAILLLMMLF